MAGKNLFRLGHIFRVRLIRSTDNAYQGAVNIPAGITKPLNATQKNPVGIKCRRTDVKIGGHGTRVNTRIGKQVSTPPL